MSTKKNDAPPPSSGFEDRLTWKNIDEVEIIRREDREPAPEAPKPEPKR